MVTKMPNKKIMAVDVNKFEAKKKQELRNVLTNRNIVLRDKIDLLYRSILKEVNWAVEQERKEAKTMRTHEILLLLSALEETDFQEAIKAIELTYEDELKEYLSEKKTR